MSEQTADAGAAKTPADFLKSIKGKQVVVKLNSGVDYRGVLACLDGYMNIAMEETEVRSRIPPHDCSPCVTRSRGASRF
jgi:U6 snRNA-associated Sm-like protein LSm6